MPLVLATGLAFGAFEALAAGFVIDTPVTTTDGGNTLSTGDTLTVNAGGSIITTINFRNAIDVSSSSGNIVSNKGTITTSGLGGNGINARTGNTITNDGSITTSGPRSLSDLAIPC